MHTPQAIAGPTKLDTAPRLSPLTPQGTEGGFWRTDGNFEPVLRLKNVLLYQALDVTTSLFFSDGTEYVLPAVHLEAAGIASVNVMDAIRHAPAAWSSFVPYNLPKTCP